MSDEMLHSALNIPIPDDPAEIDLETWLQFRGRARNASARIRELEAERDVIAVEAQYLTSRLSGWVADHLTEEGARDWTGHVEPPLERLRSILAALQTNTDKP